MAKIQDPNGPFDRKPPISFKEPRGMKCPACETGNLITRSTYKVGLHSKTRRSKCSSPKCSKTFAVVMFLVEDESAYKLAHEIREGLVRPTLERRSRFGGTPPERLKVRL